MALHICCTHLSIRREKQQTRKNIFIKCMDGLCIYVVHIFHNQLFYIRFFSVNFNFKGSFEGYTFGFLIHKMSAINTVLLFKNSEVKELV